LAPLLVGQTVVAASTSGLAMRGKIIPAAALRPLIGQAFTSVKRHGKRLILELKTRRLAVQLGMTGRLLVLDRDVSHPKHTHLAVSLSEGLKTLVYADARRFGSVAIESVTDDWPPPMVGPDIFDLKKSSTRREVAQKMRQSRRTLKDALLDQRVVGGVGNIYACEALFAAGIHPGARATETALGDIESVLAAVAREAKRGVDNAGTSFRDFVDARGRPGRHQNALRVFLREGQPCHTCGAAIERFVQGQRSTFFCPACQRAG